MRATYLLFVAAVLAAGQCLRGQTPRLGSPSAFVSRTTAGGSFGPQLSSDGRYVVFASHAKNLTTNRFSGLALNIFRRDLISGETLLVSADVSGATGGDDNSSVYSVSANGRYVAFASSAANLVGDDTNSAADIFLWDASTRTTRLITSNIVDEFGIGAPPDFNPNSPVPLSSNPQISADGRWVVFESRSTNLVAITDAPNTTDVFAHDTLANTTLLVSITTAGTAATDPAASSHSPQLTPDGRFVLFASSVTNMMADQSQRPPGKMNLFRRDLQSGSTEWITRNLQSTLASYVNPNDPDFNAYGILDQAISDNGEVIAFKVNVTWNSPSTIWVFRYDARTGSLMRLGANSYAASSPQLSADGRFLAYENGTNVVIWDQVFHTNFVVNLDSSNTRPAAGISRSPALAADGRSIAFVSNAGDLVAGVSGGSFQVFWRDLIERETLLVSANTNFAPANANHELVLPVISGDGLTVAFESSATDLVSDDLNQASDVFAFDLLSDPQLACASVAASTKPALTGPGQMSLTRNCASADARVIAFFGYDSSLVANDTNRFTDVFVHDFIANTNRMITVGTNSLIDAEMSADGRYLACTRLNQIAVERYPYDVLRFDLLTGAYDVLEGTGLGAVSITLPTSVHSMSSDGRFVAFQSTATDLDPRDQNIDADIFIHDFVLKSNVLISINAAGDATAPRFAPDNQHIFFLSGNSLYMARMDQTNAPLLVSHDYGTSISQLPGVTTFAISGNSQSVIFNSSTAGGSLYRNDLGSNFVSDVCTNCESGSLSGDGRSLVFETRDFNNLRGIYLYDYTNGTIRAEGVSSPERLGLPPNAAVDSFSPVISGDGRFVVFLSRIRNPLSTTRLYVYDRSTDQTLLLTPSAEGLGLIGGPGAQLQLARDGRTVLFQSFAGDLVDADYNDNRDVFVLRLGSGDQDHDGLDDDWEMAYFNTLDRDGSGDFDGDGRTDLEEFLAGTDPTNNGSVLRVLTLMPTSGGTTVFWHANPARSYRVEYKNSITDPSWTTAAGEVRFNGATGYLLDSSADSVAQRFYRVVVLP